MTEQTVMEFVSDHVKTEGCQDSLQAHVDMLVKAAVAEDRVLWKVGVDPDGRASLIWVSMDPRLWDALLCRAIQISALEALIKGVLP